MMLIDLQSMFTPKSL